MRKRNYTIGILKEIGDEVEFFYAFPTHYAKNFSGDRTLIVPNTFAGMLLGNVVQGAFITVAGMLLRQNLSTLLPYITYASSIPLTTNLISGIYEKAKSREMKNLENRLPEDD